MEPEYNCKIVLLDFGHPMNCSTVENIIKSLENILALRLTFSPHSNQTNFGILILDSEFKMFDAESNLRKNYDLIIKNLSAAPKKVRSKVTVQEYKYLLRSSIDRALNELQEKKANCHNIKARNELLKFIIITRKSASVLADILTNVTNKQKNIPNVDFIKSYKVVQILNEQQHNFQGASVKNDSINWTFCLDGVNNLNNFFKGCLLNPKQELRILLSNDLKLEVKCDMFDCAINPISFVSDLKFDLFNEVKYTCLNSSRDLRTDCFSHGYLNVACSRVGKSSNLYTCTAGETAKNITHPQVLKRKHLRHNSLQFETVSSELVAKVHTSLIKEAKNKGCPQVQSGHPAGVFKKRKSQTEKLLGILKLVNNLEITHRLPVDGLCPTLVFGTPRRIHATTSRSLSEADLEVNWKIFKELCRELNRVGQGLLAKSVTPTENSELISFHFLTSDGDMLLMNDVASDELHLSKRTASSNTVDSSFEEETAASVVKSCFQEIQFFDEYNPMDFSSGIYDYLKSNLTQFGQSKSLIGRFNSNSKLFRKRKTKQENLQTFPNDCESSTFDTQENQKKKPRQSANKELERVHPALLSTDVIDKYRKVPSNAFNLSELGEEYQDNVTKR